jgi:hypothetical protein
MLDQLLILHSVDLITKVIVTDPITKVTTYPFTNLSENGGWDNWEVIKIEDCPCECDEDLRRVSDIG